MQLYCLQLVVAISVTSQQPGLELHATSWGKHSQSEREIEYSASETAFDEEAPEQVRKHRRRQRVCRYDLSCPPKVASQPSERARFAATPLLWVIETDCRAAELVAVPCQLCRGPPSQV
jgi:hypothetical protein